MAGTRLAIHSTFVLELFVLIVLSVLYASTKIHHEDPFIVDRSGWKLVAETVSPVDRSKNFVDRLVHASRRTWTKLDRLLLGNDAYTKHIADERLPSAFVHEMKRAVSNVSSRTLSNGEFITTRFPPSNIQLSMPQKSLDSKLHDLAMALERGLQREHSLISVSVAEGVATSKMPAASVTSSSFCDEWTMPPYATEHHHEVQKFQLIILTGCSSSIPPDSEGKTILQMSRDAPILILRTSHNPVSPDDFYSRLHSLLEGDVASILSDVLDVSPSSTTHLPRKLTRLSLEIVDENPALRSESLKNAGSTPKEELEYLGEMFDSLVKSLVYPLWKDLSLVFGERDRRNVPVGATTRLSAYLPLEEEIIESDPNKAHVDGRMINFVSTKQMSKWVKKHWNRNLLKSTQTTELLQWVFFVPSPNHTPLMIRDESTGEEGSSITFSSPEFGDKGVGTTDTLLSGFSVVNPVPRTYRGMNGEIPMEQSVQTSFENATAAAMLHLIGYIRAIHGLSPIATRNSFKTTPAVSVTCCIEPGTSAMHRLSFWEMESIARNHWNSILEQVLHETDSLMSLLHTHGDSLAFPETVAHTLNNATRLLRYSVSLAEQGYPAIHSTSALYDSLRYIEEVRSHHELMELPHFAFDHYLAVFSPLVLPLLMPMIMGLVRELKRFKKLRNKGA
ncbi:hypothetical protein ACHAW6_006186 [Cyclotella cf. meneghiniana]